MNTRDQDRACILMLYNTALYVHICSFIVVRYGYFIDPVTSLHSVPASCLLSSSVKDYVQAGPNPQQKSMQFTVQCVGTLVRFALSTHFMQKGL